MAYNMIDVAVKNVALLVYVSLRVAAAGTRRSVRNRIKRFHQSILSGSVIIFKPINE